jgi:ectoine hydroxylase-related dioxygenase (phytanoyl-CoA dioxygenase family)
MQISVEDKQRYNTEGYLIVKSVLNEQEISNIKNRFMELHAGGPIEGCFQPLPPEESEGDILKQYPRMMHPHRVDQLALSYMIHPKVMGILAGLMDEEPLACQSMFYFKPPGARGQALHQDNFFLRWSRAHVWLPGWRLTQLMRKTGVCMSSRKATYWILCVPMRQIRSFLLQKMKWMCLMDWSRYQRI